MKSLAIRPFQGSFNPDRLGVAFSVLCAIHCAITPFLLLLNPMVGRIWSHPASHWLVAIAVVPLAGFSVYQASRRHQQRWIPICGVSGIVLILVGAMLPYLEPSQSVADAPAPVVTEDEDVFVYVVGSDEADDTEVSCADSCCPSLVTDTEGHTRLHIPPASIVTTLGGIGLILTHLGNLCCCTTCGKDP